MGAPLWFMTKGHLGAHKHRVAVAEDPPPCAFYRASLVQLGFLGTR